MMNMTKEKNIKNKPLIISDGCCIQYGDSSALDDVTFSISEGKKVAVVGPNGGGKSTLFNAIAGLLPLAHGSLKIKESCLGELRYLKIILVIWFL